MFPSPCGVRRVRDKLHSGELAALTEAFPSPCGVRRVRDSNPLTKDLPTMVRFRPLAG